MAREIYVFGDWLELDEPQQIGTLRADVARGSEVLSFEYTDTWLARGDVMLLDPDLQLMAGPQYLNDRERANFGLFLDSSPDRWGKLIIKRREAIEARNEKRKQNELFETDFLLEVHDQQRMGGLRFKLEKDGEFVSSHKNRDAPPWARVRELENAAWQYQNADWQSQNDNSVDEWLELLIAPGSSIGGARPKAGIRDEQENLWIAKFPGRNDEYDVGLWELLVSTLAKESGLDVAEARAEKFGLSHHTYLVKRFDRVVDEGNRRRKHFASAMTMLGYSDGTSFRDGASYLEIVEFLTRYGSETSFDLTELWKRIVFSICVSNTDDHLRNHGFLLNPDGWKLSPAYDINAEPKGRCLSLNITEVDNSLDTEVAREAAHYFGVDSDEAKEIIGHTRDIVSGWRSLATEMGISRSEQEIMAPAFIV